MLTQMNQGQKRSYEGMIDDELQIGRGQKRSIDEVTNGASDEDNFFTVDGVKRVNVKKIKTTGMDYHIRFTNTFEDVELSKSHGQLHEIFQRMLDEVTDGVPVHDQVRSVLHSPQLEKPISFPFMPRQRLTTERVLAELERVIQFNREFRLNDTVDVNIIHVEMPHGGKGSKRSEINLEKHLIQKRSIVRIQNNDDLCLARALIVAKARIDDDPQYKYIADNRKPMQGRLAQELHQNVAVALGPCGLDEVKQFQTYLTNYQINIVSKDHQNAHIYSGPDQEKRIYLYLHNNHYDVITKMPGFLARKMYCHFCKKAYDHGEDHLCSSICKCCRFPDCPVGSWIHCNDCNRYFKSQTCFDRHKEFTGNAKPICAMLVRCSHCDRIVKQHIEEIPKNIIAAKQNVPSVKSIPNPVITDVISNLSRNETRKNRTVLRIYLNKPPVRMT